VHCAYSKEIQDLFAGCLTENDEADIMAEFEALNVEEVCARFLFI
jgi:hypothetical protein